VSGHPQAALADRYGIQGQTGDHRRQAEVVGKHNTRLGHDPRRQEIDRSPEKDGLLPEANRWLLPEGERDLRGTLRGLGGAKEHAQGTVAVALDGVRNMVALLLRRQAPFRENDRVDGCGSPDQNAKPVPT
jgi:hypothetical protein